jgi:hypothetical protein
LERERGNIVDAKTAQKELLININLNFSHAVLLRDKKGSWKTELHGGHAGNCCCDQHDDFVWREESPYTDPTEVRQIFARSSAAAALGRVKSPRKAATSRENGKKGGRPRTLKSE